MSRRTARTEISRGTVFVNGRRCQISSRWVLPGTVVRWDLEDGREPQPLRLRFLYENDEVWVVDKPPGIHVNRTQTTSRLSVAERLGSHARVVHRLDLETSGVLLVAKTLSAAHRLSKLFQLRQVRKEYAALCVLSARHQLTSGDVTCRQPLGPDPRRPRAWSVRADGKASVTTLKLLGRCGDLALVEARPETGRTHQIRLHAQALGASVWGDLLYGGHATVRAGARVLTAPRVMLHARRLSFTLDGEEHAYTSPWPSDFLEGMRLTNPPAESWTD